jgi:hypothetical protein
VFGDRIQITTGMLAIEAGGIAALIVGVVAVARSSAFSSLRRIPHVIRPGSEEAAPHTTLDTPASRPSRDRSPRRQSPNGAAFSAPGTPVARKFSRPAHRRQIQDSPSAGDGR